MDISDKCLMQSDDGCRMTGHMCRTRDYKQCQEYLLAQAALKQQSWKTQYSYQPKGEAVGLGWHFDGEI